MDAIHYKIQEEGKIVPKAVYTILGLNVNGIKDVIGIYVSESEGSNFWLQVLTDLSNRGVKDIRIAFIDGLKGFSEAIKTISPGVLSNHSAAFSIFRGQAEIGPQGLISC